MKKQYFRELSALFSKIEASGRLSARIALDEALNRAVKLIQSQSKKNRKVIFIGNGGSAAIASHQAVDFWKNGGIAAIAFNDAALLSCVSNDFGYEEVFAKPVGMFACGGDVLIAISSSGQSRNILNAVRQARDKGCMVITLSGFAPANSLRSQGDINFYLPSDSYGFVEITHLAIIHCILDTIISAKKPLK